MQRVRRLLAITLSVCAALSAPGAASARSRVQVVSRVPTTKNVVFITIDDGFHRTPAAAETLERLRWPVTNFVLPATLGGKKTAYFSQLGYRAEFGNHTEHHTKLEGRSLRFQKREICGADRALEAKLEQRTTFFRPPFGAYDSTTVKAAQACGMTHLVMWRATVYGDTIATWGGPIRRGDIILLHHIQSLGASLDTLARELRRLGLQPALLSDYLR